MKPNYNQEISTRTFIPLSLLCLIMLGLWPAATTSLAQTNPAPKPPDIPAMIKSSDPAKQKEGLTLLNTRLNSLGKSIQRDTLNDWLRALDEAHLDADAADLAARALPLFRGRDNAVVISLLARRALASLQAGRKEDALAFLQEASGLEFNSTLTTLANPRLMESLIRADLLPQCLETLDKGSLAQSADVGILERALTLRAQYLLAANKPQEALATAKSLFNVSSMAGTENALRILAKCLQTAYPENRDLLVQFRDQQLAGADTSAATRPSPTKSSVLASIKIDPTPYAKALPKDLEPFPTEEDFNKLTRMGNLLLILDRPQDAKPWFEQAYRVAGEKQLSSATESLARVLKAEDGAIGRANAFALSLRPKKM